MPELEPTTLPTTLSKKGIPCRTCTDFKSWARQQRDIMGKSSDTDPKPVIGFLNITIV